MSLKHEVQIRKLEEKVARLERILSSMGPTTTSTAYEKVHKGWGKFSVYGPEGEVANNLSKPEAEAKVKALNGGH